MDTFQAPEEQRLKQQAQREKERVEEGQKLRRERAAEKARVEAAALEKQNREKKELEDKKEVRAGPAKKNRVIGPKVVCREQLQIRTWNIESAVSDTALSRTCEKGYMRIISYRFL